LNHDTLHLPQDWNKSSKSRNSLKQIIKLQLSSQHRGFVLPGGSVAAVPEGWHEQAIIFFRVSIDNIIWFTKQLLFHLFMKVQ
jgi:hypothetical protein